MNAWVNSEIKQGLSSVKHGHIQLRGVKSSRWLDWRTLWLLVFVRGALLLPPAGGTAPFALAAASPCNSIISRLLQAAPKPCTFTGWDRFHTGCRRLARAQAATGRPVGTMPTFMS